MQQFDLSVWLKDKSRKIVTRDGRPVRIVCWDAPTRNPIYGFVEGDYGITSWRKDGRFCNLIDNVDLFFADEEKCNKILNELKSYLKSTPKEQVEKDWKEIQDWYAQHFTNEKHNEEEELTEFEKTMIQFSHERNSLIQFEHTTEEINTHLYLYSKKLLNLARKELEPELDKKLKESYNQGGLDTQEEITKCLPKWKKIPHGISRKELLDMMHKGIVTVFNGYKDYYYFDKTDLEKLPKEE